MNRLSAHLGYLYTELPLAERLAAAARDGFTAVEHPAPYAIAAPEMRRRLGDLGLGFAQITSGMGNPGEKGLAALPGREDDFRAGFLRARDYAAEVGIPFVHPMAGVPGVAPSDSPGWAETYHANIAWSLTQLDGFDQRLLVEAITIPGYAMPSLAAAIALQDAYPGAIALLLDSFHAATLGEDAPAWIAVHGARIGHVHIADHPGRHEPGTGRLDFAALLGALAKAPYGGAIGFEYIPSTSTAESLRFLPGWIAALSQPATGAKS